MSIDLPEDDLAEGWAVEVLNDDGAWKPVAIFLDKVNADEEHEEWAKNSAPTDQWRVTRYVPSGERK